jgi:hypothetical protein
LWFQAWLENESFRTLSFGSDSRLRSIKFMPVYPSWLASPRGRYPIRSFLQVSSRSVKVFRAKLQFRSGN